METDIQNRQDQPRKKGRPSLAEVAARSAPVVPTPATVPNPSNPSLPPLVGFICLGCGRAQNPRIQNTQGSVRYVACGMCGARHRVEYRDARPNLIQLI